MLTRQCAMALLILIINMLTVDFVTSSNYKEMEIVDDLPVKANLEKYLLSLEKIIYFVNSHRLYVDLNLNFGVFLVNVNLRNTLQLRGHRLPVHKRVRLERVVKTNDDIMRYFKRMVEKYITELDNLEAPVGMVNLFTNETSWPNHLKEFNIELLNKTKFYSRKELEVVYLKWPNFKKRIYNVDLSSSPTPAESDSCLALLAQNPINDRIKLGHCQVPYVCAKLVLSGTNFGYGITHRILFLILSRFSRGCALLSDTEDKELLDSLCAKVYNEAEFITYHDFELPDLFMEQICLCSLEGHAQFVRRSWVDEVIDFQTAPGCFNLSRPFEEDASEESPYENFAWQFTIADQMIMGNTCNVHTTAVAAGMLAGAIRYIMENYY